MAKDNSCCKICGKRLIDEKIPVCSRCKLEIRNKGGKITAFVGGIGIAAVNAYNLLNGENTDNNV
ncbi:hypothetical protein SAMN02910289_00649 [Lachnospiraceae bacterium RM5]|nr:hypothetical protein SAMN02910289_00649 [Lachnospiraceae bacterium RM5]